MIWSEIDLLISSICLVGIRERGLMVGYQEIKESRIRVSPDGRRALLLGNQGSIFCVDLSVRRTDKPRQLASSIRDGCFYDNDTCYFISGWNWIGETDG